jgi:hypothetical protein
MAKVTEKSLSIRCTQLNLGPLRNTTFGIRAERLNAGYTVELIYPRRYPSAGSCWSRIRCRSSCYSRRCGGWCSCSSSCRSRQARICDDRDFCTTGWWTVPEVLNKRYNSWPFFSSQGDYASGLLLSTMWPGLEQYLSFGRLWSFHPCYCSGRVRCIVED